MFAEELMVAANNGGERAVVLLSGGMDSATCLAVARAEGLACYALTIDYGQLHSRELEAARRVAASLGVSEHRIMKVPLNELGGSSLVGQGRVPEEPVAGIPSTYVPARNLVFLSLAAAWAEVLQARAIYIGVSQVDYSGYPDCRADFLDAFAAAARLGTRAGREGRAPEIRTPLIDLDKAATIELGLRLGLDYSLTHTCYRPEPDGRSCGVCPACRLRLAGFRRAGRQDPLPYLRRGQ